MSYPLSSNQKEALRWIVAKVEAGEMEEDALWTWTQEGPVLPEKDLRPPQHITVSTFEALAQNGLVQIEQGQEKGYRVSLTEQAYKAVASGFEESSVS